ncbi:MAG: tRNA (adenosine(37)-N6)-threonylcarbamoyltransferase complex dimerization subunit type 1 TsaB [Bacteroidetes bacterium]|nr:MAG: tRNA (adenosine(37)-N6)-threonylcarbamoyltransferase complex dimerization subunit type 1 TsaB [Bacteroidota bacterium]
MSRILCIESSAAICSVGLYEDGNELGYREDRNGFKHSEMLAAFVDELLPLGKPDAIAISKGPGSYTGLRIGVSLAKGLAYGFGIPVIAIPTLEALAESVRETRKEEVVYYPMVDARRMEVYTAGYDSEGKEIEATHALVVEANSLTGDKKKLLFGDGADKLQGLLGDRQDIEIISGIFPEAKQLAKPAFRKFEKQEFEDLAYFEPFYLKEFVAQLPKKKL